MSLFKTDVPSLLRNCSEQHDKLTVLGQKWTCKMKRIRVTAMKHEERLMRHIVQAKTMTGDFMCSLGTFCKAKLLMAAIGVQQSSWPDTLGQRAL